MGGRSGRDVSVGLACMYSMLSPAFSVESLFAIKEAMNRTMEIRSCVNG